MHQDSYHWYRPEGFRPEEHPDRLFTTSQVPDTVLSELSCQIHTDSKHTSFFRWKSVLCTLLGIAVLAVLIAGTAVLSRRADSALSTSSLPPDSDILWDDPTSDSPDQKDYHNFFDTLYGDSSFSGTNSLPTVAGDPAVSLTLAPAGSSGEALDLTALYAQCSPSIVSVSAYWDDESYTWGSGVLFSSDGYIVTNNHVIENAVSAEVILCDDRTFEAVLVGCDAQTDLAVLKIDAAGLTPATFGDSDSLQIGESVAAIGNPIGSAYRNTMTNGIISAIGREVTANGRSMCLLQTNTAINKGNSGGALFNRYGQVIGITNMKIASPDADVEGIGFSIPSRTVAEVVNSLIQASSVPHGVLGITMGVIPETISSYYKIPQGLYISAVNKNADAYVQGVRAGDILTKVNGSPVSTTDEVMAFRDQCQIGESLTLTLYRDGETRSVDVKLYDANAVEQH